MQNALFTRLLSILILLSGIGQLRAQQMVVPNKLWSYYTYEGQIGSGPDSHPIGSNVAYTFGEAEEVDGETYLRLHTCDYFSFEAIDPAGTNFLMREDSLGRVFLKEDGLPEVMIYDFSLSVDDIFLDPFDGCEYLVIAKDTISLLNGELRERILFEDQDAERSWIKGIGSTRNLIPNCYEIETSIVCHQEGEELTYAGPLHYEAENCFFFPVRVEDLPLKALSISPNPFASSLIIRSEGELLQGELLLYNAAGQRVLRKSLQQQYEYTLPTAHLPAGVYYLQLGEYRQKLVKTK